MALADNRIKFTLRRISREYKTKILKIRKSCQTQFPAVISWTYIHLTNIGYYSLRHRRKHRFYNSVAVASSSLSFAFFHTEIWLGPNSLKSPLAASVWNGIKWKLPLFFRCFVEPLHPWRINCRNGKMSLMLRPDGYSLQSKTRHTRTKSVC